MNRGGWLAGGLTVLASLASGSARATAPAMPVRVVAAQGSRLPALATITAKPLSTTGPDLTFEVDPQKELLLPLVGGEWLLTATIGGFWCDEQVLTAGSGNPATITAWPTGIVLGRLSREVASEGKALFVGFEPADRSRSDPRGAVRCSVERTEWRCEVPAGLLDVQFNVAGRSSDYRWGLSVEAKAESRLDDLQMIHGPSMVGWIDNPPSPPLAATITLRHPETAAVTVDGEKDPEKPMTRATPRGFFQFVGLKPGEYALRAEAGSAGEAEIVVSVQPDRESRLDVPLHLSPLAVLSVVVDPPLDPAGHAWILQVDRLGTTALQGLTRDTLPPTGTWRRSLSRGSYLLSLNRADGSKWTSKLAKVSEDIEVALQVGRFNVTGDVRLGTEPLSATLVFGANTEEKVQFTSGPDGSFSGLLPRGGRWTVEIDCAAPPIHRTVRGVDVVPDGNGEGNVKIKLDDTVVRGVVVDAQGRPKEGIISASPREVSDPPMSMRTKPDGVFELRGLPAGSASLVARAERSSSDPVVVQVGADAGGGTTLQLKANRSVRGRVLSAEGPVWSAQVLIAPIPPSSTGVMRTTDADGLFEAEMPDGTFAVSAIVSARSFALRITRLDLQTTESDPVILLEPLGGTLRIVLPQPELAEGCFLLHEGGASGLTPLRGWLYRQGLENPPLDASQLDVPQMHPGTYTACTGGRASLAEKLTTPASTAAGHCVTATLVPGGEAMLDLSALAIARPSASVSSR
jgi:hypothetical protein